ncbi:MAG: DUF2800 domain-containing protein [Methylocella sp.]
MSTHKLFAPSAAHRWMACPGSMAFPENQETDGTSSSFADDGTASHELGAMTLSSKKDCHEFIGLTIAINGTEYTFDEERCDRIQGYVDDVRRRAIGGHLFVEQQVDLSDHLGPDQGGTTDAAIALAVKRMGIVEDLKDGSGEKVWASYLVRAATETEPEIREPNPQLALYALGLLSDFELFGEIDSVLLVVYQPKLNHIDEFPITVEHLRAFGSKAALAVEVARSLLDADPVGLSVAGHLNPGEKQCRWCRAKTRCPALAKFVQDETRADFDTINAAPAVAPTDTKLLARAYGALPLIEIWATAVRFEMNKIVSEGGQVIGPDGKPYKFVEGKEGTRKWDDESAAATALLGQLPKEKVYTEPKVITAPAAAKLLDKKATKQLWKDIFEPLIVRPRTKPVLVMGSDTRPAFSGAAVADDFEEDIGS